MGYRLFEEGPQGRAIYVDENNRLVMDADPTTSGYIYQYGPKGYPLLVDASGRLLVNVSGVQGVVNSDIWAQNGFVDYGNDSTISFDDATRKFQIAATGTSFKYLINGVEHATSGASVTLTDTEGVHFIYFNDDTLTATVNPTADNIDDLIRLKAIVGVVYWSTTKSAAIFVGDERHSKNMSPDTHSYLHFTQGMQYLDGLGLSSMSIDGTGDDNADAQFAVDAGNVADEDLHNYSLAVPAATGVPMYHLIGSGAITPWTMLEPSGYSVVRAGDAAGDRLAYNQFTGGQWQLTEITNGNFVLTHIFATSEIDRPIIGILGQNEYSNIVAARTGADTEIRELVTNQILLPEILPIATVIFQTSNLYDNAVKARVRSTSEGDNYVDWRSETISRVTVSTSDHNSLTGLQGGAANEYYHLTEEQHATINDVTTQAATSGTYNVDWAAAGMTIITLDGDITFTFANATHGQKHIIKIKQDAAGAHLVTWPGTVQWPGGTAPTLTATSGGMDYIGFIYDGNDNTHDGLANSLDFQ
jgi:hypothetical protein